MLDTHDVSRFLSVCNGDVSSYKAAVFFQMTFPGMPTIFYGDENGLEGILEADYRRPMDWNGKGELYDFFRDIIAVRKKHSPLQDGDFRIVQADKNSEVFIYERYNADMVIRAIINMSDDTISLKDSDNYGDVIYQNGFENGSLGGKGFILLER